MNLYCVNKTSSCRHVFVASAPESATIFAPCSRTARLGTPVDQRGWFAAG